MRKCATSEAPEAPRDQSLPADVSESRTEISASRLFRGGCRKPLTRRLSRNASDGIMGGLLQRTRGRLRKHVDPSWITPAKRPTNASDLDGCALAFDVREELRKPR